MEFGLVSPTPGDRSAAESGLSLGVCLVWLPGGRVSGCRRSKHTKSQVLIEEILSLLFLPAQGEERALPQ